MEVILDSTRCTFFSVCKSHDVRFGEFIPEIHPIMVEAMLAGIAVGERIAEKTLELINERYRTKYTLDDVHIETFKEDVDGRRSSEIL